MSLTSKHKNINVSFSIVAIIKDNWVVLAGLALLVCAIYANGLGNEFVSDDIEGILTNRSIKYFSTIYSNILYSFPSTVQNVIYFFTSNIFGLTPWAFRSSNILFHAGNTLLLFIIVHALHSKRTAIMASFLFAAHPVLVESITWISAGSYARYTFFILLGLLLYVRSVSDPKYIWYSMGAFLLAVFSSEKAAVFPALIGTFYLSYRLYSKNWKYLLLLIVPGIIAGAIFVSRIALRQHILSTTFQSDISTENPLLQIPVALISYIVLFVWPNALTLYHSELRFTYIQYALILGLFLALITAMIYLFYRSKYIFFWLSLFVISLIPTLLPFGVGWIVAERYVYFGICGLSVTTSLLLTKLMVKFPKSESYVYTCVCIVVCLFSVRSFVRNFDWKSHDTLWLATAKFSPSSPQNHNNLGDYFGRQGDMQRAVWEFQTAIKLKPNYADAYHNLANTYMQMGQLATASAYFQEAVKYNPNLWQSYTSLAMIMYAGKDTEKAMQYIDKSLEILPNNPANLARRAIILSDNGRKDEAIRDIDLAVKLSPSDPTLRELQVKISSE